MVLVQEYSGIPFAEIDRRKNTIDTDQNDQQDYKVELVNAIAEAFMLHLL